MARHHTHFLNNWSKTKWKRFKVKASSIKVQGKINSKTHTIQEKNQNIFVIKDQGLFKIDFFKVLLLVYVFLAVLGLHFCSGFSLVVVSGSTLYLKCLGVSLQWLLLLQSTGSRNVGFSSCGCRALHRLSSCGTHSTACGNLP